MKKILILLVILSSLLFAENTCYNITRSSFINEVCYDDETEELQLQLNYHWYSYHNVPYDKFYGLMNASSMGRYYNSYIKGIY